ncbi:helix-turn-helix domain-containing protein [Oerskovia jenensis]|uniref:helix-turn-helix domain-containing protein n=1 Tax=Oerskovia jenensis TaxID=162169 RepID=UPI0036DC0F4C
MPSGDDQHRRDDRRWSDDRWDDGPVPLSRIAAGAVRLESARRDITQEDLAELLGRSRSAVSQRFTGKVAWSLDDLGTIAATFGYPVAHLLDDGPPGRRR